jgi:hypothetical protein
VSDEGRAPRGAALTIGELSRRTGVPIRLLREYERLGLLYTLGRSGGSRTSASSTTGLASPRRAERRLAYAWPEEATRSPSWHTSFCAS